MVLSGLAMIVVGAWLAAQAIGGNLAGRIRSWASSTLTAEGGSSSSPPSSSSNGSSGGSSSVN